MNKWYYARDYSHKHERAFSSIGGNARPGQVRFYYPWVKRECFKTYCTENLIFSSIGSHVPLHEARFENYRINPFFDPKLENRSCAL